MLQRSDVGVLDAPTSSADGWRPLESVAQESFENQLPFLEVRGPEPGFAEMRVTPHVRCANVMGGLHGGFLAAIAEQSLFLPLYLHGRCSRGGIVVIDFNLSYLSGGDISSPIIAKVELLRETGRMAFVRGTLRQRETALVSYSGTVRKIDPR